MISYIFLADIFGTCGMFLFLLAEIKQLIKILKTHNVSGISLTAYKSKLFAAVCTCICFGLTNLYISFVVILLEAITLAIIMRLIRRYKNENIIFST